MRRYRKIDAYRMFSSQKTGKQENKKTGKQEDKIKKEALEFIIR